MKKLMSLVAALFILCLSAAPAMAASKPSDIQVEITSPTSIDSVPIHNDTVEVSVTNNGKTTYRNLSCYLNIVDVGRGQTYPVDEFGENAYQTRTIASLAPGESTVISIPVRIMYVGNFRFTASVIDYGTGQNYTGNALSVVMTETSHLNKNLVIIVAVAVPALLTVIVSFLTHGKKKAKE